VKTQNGYREARGGWSCSDCRFKFQNACSHLENRLASGDSPYVSNLKVCDLFSPRHVRRIRDARPGTDTRSPAEYADAQYHGAAGEW
jgi:hypothetical protein